MPTNRIEDERRKSRNGAYSHSDSESDFQERDAAHYFSRRKEGDWEDGQKTDGGGWTHSELLHGMRLNKTSALPKKLQSSRSTN